MNYFEEFKEYCEYKKLKLSIKEKGFIANDVLEFITEYQLDSVIVKYRLKRVRAYVPTYTNKKFTFNCFAVFDLGEEGINFSIKNKRIKFKTKYRILSSDNSLFINSIDKELNELFSYGVGTLKYKTEKDKQFLYFKLNYLDINIFDNLDNLILKTLNQLAATARIS